jgi:hypothetical protein
MAEAVQSPLRGSAGGNRIKEGFRDRHRDGSVRRLGHRLIEKSRLAVHNPTCRDPTTGVPSLLCLTLASCAEIVSTTVDLRAKSIDERDPRRYRSIHRSPGRGAAVTGHHQRCTVAAIAPITVRRLCRPGSAWRSAPRCRYRRGGRRFHPGSCAWSRSPDRRGTLVSDPPAARTP